MSEMTFTAVIVKDGSFFVAECPEVGTVSQGVTYEEALGNLKEATEIFLEEFPSQVKNHPILTSFEAEVG
jgi:predicted RNase H-like HicB family nuclease